MVRKNPTKHLVTGLQREEMIWKSSYCSFTGRRKIRTTKQKIHLQECVQKKPSLERFLVTKRTCKSLHSDYVSVSVDYCEAVKPAKKKEKEKDSRNSIKDRYVFDKTQQFW